MSVEHLYGDKRILGRGLDQVAATQRQIQRRLRYGEISHGTEIGLDLLCRSVARLPEISSLVVNVGSGDCYKAARQAAWLRSANVMLVAVDINPSGLQHGQMLAHFADLDNMWFIESNVVDASWVSVLGEQEANSVMAEGLWCNLIGDDARYALEQVSRVLAPGGTFLVADCLHVDDPEGRELLATDPRWNKRYIDAWAKRWRMRYKRNASAFC